MATVREDAFKRQFPFGAAGEASCSEGALFQLGLPGARSLVGWFLRAREHSGEPAIELSWLSEGAAPRWQVAYRPWSDGPPAGRLTLHDLLPDTLYRFRFTLDGTPFELEARTAPDPSSRRAFRFLAFSCCAPFTGDAAQPVSPRALNTLRALAATSERPPELQPAFALGLGDQVYADEGAYRLFPPAHSLLGGRRSQRLRYRGQASAHFETLYRAHFSLAPFAHALRRIPGALIWDDHEIRDGWGSHGDERARAAQPDYRAHLDAARSAFLACQALRNPNLSEPSGAAALAELGADATWPELHFSFDWGADTSVFVMDQRSARRYDSASKQGAVLSDRQRADLAAWLERGRARPGRLYVLVSPIPLTQPRWSRLDPARWLPFRGDDLRDRFWHEARAGEAAEILRMLVERFRPAPSDRLLILSGDVHYHEVRELSVMDDRDGQRVIGHEVVSSGLAQGSFFEIYEHVHAWNEHRPAFPETGLISKSLGRHLGAGFAELMVAPEAEGALPARPPKVSVFFHLADRRAEGITLADPCDEAYALSWDAPVHDAPDVLRSFLHPRGRSRLEAVYRRELERLASRRTARARREEDAWYQGADRANLFGVALSGGGIRSATLSLGFLRRFHQAGYLEHVDYLSSVSGGSYANGYLQASAWSAAQSAASGESVEGHPLDDAFSDARVTWLNERGSYLALGAGAKGGLNKLRLFAAYAGTLLAHWASLLSLAFCLGCAVLVLDPLLGDYLSSALRLLAFAGLVTFVFRLLLSQVSDRAAIAGTRVEGVLSLLETATLAPLLGLGSLWLLSGFVPWAFTWPATVADWARAAVTVTSDHLLTTTTLAFAAGAFVQWSTREPVPFTTRLAHCLWAGLKYLWFAAAGLLVLHLFGRLAPPLLALFSELSTPGALLVSLLVMLLLWSITSPNSTSMQRYFAARIMDTFLRAQEQRELGGVHAQVEGPHADLVRARRHKQRRALRLMKMADLRDAAAPYPLFNACVNLVGRDDDAFAGVRASDYFLFAPDHCGAKLLGYAATRPGQRYESVSVAEAVGCSAAAISPFQGRRALSPLALVLWLLNLRTDLWLPHPTGGARRAKDGPSDRAIFWGPLLQLRALFGKLDTRQPVVNVSDGGFIDNLGLIELLRRRCRLIVALDCTWDPQYAFKELRNAVVRARQELGLTIDFLVEPEKLVKPSADSGLTQNCFALARVGTAEGHPDPWHEGGILVYVKASELVGKRVRSHGELRSRADLAYRTFHPDFPHEPTTDQFFNQEQWRAYFELGSILADAALGQALSFDPRAPEQRGQSKQRERVAMDALIARYTDILRGQAR